MSVNNYKEITSCEVCDSINLESVLDLGEHPMCDDLIEVGNDRICNEYPIEILFCKTCNTAHQRFQVPKEDLFPNNYHYRSRFTADVLTGMKDLVNSCKQRLGDLKGKKVLDIGFNDGSLLDFFSNDGAVTYGIEPTGAYLDAKEKGHKTYNEYLSEEVAENIVGMHGQPDVITFTNVFAHIEDLKSVLRSLKILMSQDTTVIIENHYLGAVLDGNQFDTFYHEHPRTYSYTSFSKMADTLGTNLSKVEFPSRYGGNIRVYLGGPKNLLLDDDMNLENLIAKENKFFDDFLMLRKNIDNWIKKKSSIINNLYKNHGKLIAKAFPGRAAILIKLLKLDNNIISKVYEKPGSLKIGHKLPGTNIPIHSDEELINSQDKTVPIINLAWHISKEINQYLKNNQFNGEIIDILCEEDFKS